jgi:hypothetical protein
MAGNKSIVLSMAFIAAAIFIGYANAESYSGKAKYTLVSSDGIAYRMNTETGEISVCVRGMTMEEAVGCTPWSR